MLSLALLAACTGPKPADTAAPADSAEADSDDSAVDTDSGGPDTFDSVETADSGDSGDDTDRPPAEPPGAADPFVITGCGFSASTTLGVVPDMDGDGVEELLAIAGLADEVAGTWLVPSSSATMPYWDQPLRWAIAPTEGVRALPDLDGDGLAELFAYDDDTTATQLLPDGTLGPTWADVPARFLPWHDADGDGRDDLLVGAPGLYAPDAPLPGYVGLVATPGVDPTTWTTIATTAGDAEDGLGTALVRATLDQDGDGWPEVVVTDGEHGHLLSSAAIDAGATLADATLLTFAEMGGLTPVALGDVDGGGVEDFAFQADSAPSFAWLVRGEAPDAPVYFGSGYDTWSVAIGPDGAGGQLLWALSGGASGYDLADALGGTFTRVRHGWTSVYLDRIVASSEVLWVVGTTWGAGRWDTRPVAYRLDPLVEDDVLAQVDGGGPGYGGEVTAYGLDDIDGDGMLDWWQLSRDDAALQWAPVTPGASITVCDGTSVSQPDWYAADPGDDLDGDGVPEIAWWREPETIGLWSSATGELAEATFDGAVYQLGCDITGDGVGELQLDSPFQAWIVDGAAWARGDESEALLGEIDDGAVCVGDLDGDGVPEIADAYLDVTIWDGASVAAGESAALSYVDGPAVGYLQALGDVDGDGLGDLSFYARGYTTGYFGRCIVTGAEALARPVNTVAELTHCWDDGTTWSIPVDLDGDGVSELLQGTDEGALTTWSFVTGATEVVWTPADDARDEPLTDVVVDAFGPGRPALVLGTDPLVIYALGE